MFYRFLIFLKSFFEKDECISLCEASQIFDYEVEKFYKDSMNLQCEINKRHRNKED